jgi:HAD superfamily hydrolase (TIGR01509 family)
LSAILFGSISTVADTSELQRQAFNQAFAEHGLDWQWDRDDYREMLAKSGGQSRIAEFAQSRGQEVDAAAVHATKSRFFQDNLATADIAPREGVVDTIKDAKSQGWKVGFVTTTSADNISALLGALSPAVQSTDFDLIVDSSDVDEPKPNPAAYNFALQRLTEDAGHCVAIEDNAGGIEAAQAAGLVCVAFPNQNTAALDLGPADLRVDRLDVEQLQKLVSD